ncbi:putative tricarboxylic transport membrane protein [Rhodoligotrophos appendicifer]|uniref:tripartite tricarboxylate transporter permease n=1 Tax=Rhodoligotrophos appendicifer TaxID=987056 RepID=UPI0011807B19|nr:tripartite tricarboxylate transporter permease [Rhodoligotrophos appendicifer]
MDNILLGFAQILTLDNMGLCLAGALVGTLVGVLPGLGPLATLAILLPITFGLEPLGALVMLAGVYYGSQYGGSTTAILVNLPGESSSVVTCIDGHEMTKQGRAGEALFMAATGSFMAGCVGTLVIALAAPSIGAFAQQFASPEYTALLIFGLIAAVVIASGSAVEALVLALIGVLLGFVGTDINSGAERYTFGRLELLDGLQFVPLALGFFGIPEIIANLEHPEQRKVLTAKLGSIWPRWPQIKAGLPAMIRGTGLGTMLGVLPGGGALLSSFVSYSVEKRLATDPSRFGKGAVEGVAGPEAANNAGAQTSFIPLLTLGIPSNPVMAIMMGAMILHGIQPGPQVIAKQPELFWGLVASMWMGNLFLLVINLPMIGLWVKLLSVPYRLLFPLIVAIACIGIYSVNNSAFDVFTAMIFGAIGYVFYKLKLQPAPLLLGFIVGPLLEENMRRSLTVSRGDPTVFFTRPISGVLMAGAIVLLLALLLPAIRRGREIALKE